MPAVTADTLTLPKIAAALEAADRSVPSVTTAPGGFEGEGFPVRRAFAGVDLTDLDPFIHMDQMGEVDYAAVRAEGHRLAPPPRASRPSPTCSTAPSSTRTPTVAVASSPTAPPSG